MDEKLLFLINRHWISPAMDRLMAVMSNAALWMVPLVAAGLLTLIFGNWRGRIFVLVALVTLGISDGVVGRSMKKLVNRQRPNQTEVNVRQLEIARPLWEGIFKPLKEKYSLGGADDSEGRSFPSNHTLNTMSVALLAALVFRRFGWIGFLPAGAVAWSRVYTGAHWPSDVLASVFMGLGLGLSTLAAAEWLWQKVAPKHFPVAFQKHPRLLISASPNPQLGHTQ
jgi:undecaprenyl-diphosphatase